MNRFYRWFGDNLARPFARAFIWIGSGVVFGSFWTHHGALDGAILVLAGVVMLHLNDHVRDARREIARLERTHNQRHTGTRDELLHCPWCWRTHVKATPSAESGASE